MTTCRDERSSVLSLTHDLNLMMTRRLLLEREGWTVVAASNIQEFRACLLSQTFDLILLCQTISAAECESAAQFARDHAPWTRLMMMYSRVGKCMPEDADVLLDSLAGPKAFVEATQRMLSNTASHAI